MTGRDTCALSIVDASKLISEKQNHLLPSRSSESTVTCTFAGTTSMTQCSLAVVLSLLSFQCGWPVSHLTHLTTLVGRRTGSTPRLKSVCGTALPHITTPSSLSSSAGCCRSLSPSFATGASSLIFNLLSSGFSEYSYRQDPTMLSLGLTY